ncbi:hypothetical protein AB7C87_07315 [Natrarchaeobius sp. A-rgal3]|uniref:hypothetical protein n=1 Tax=Natrarchaeobius versutus TaxID=1679078 RepID=UPI00350EE330
MVLRTDLESAIANEDDLPAVDDVYDESEEIPLSATFDDAFVIEHTEFESFDDLVEASPSDASSADELGEVEPGSWDEFVAETTDFADEEQLVMAARDNWVAKKLGLA